MHRTNIYLDEAQSAALGARARAQGISRAELVRRLVGRGLDEAAHGDLEVDLAAINDAFGTLPSGGPDEQPPLPERGLDERARNLERMARR
jgi:hypothetical protein